MFLLYTLLSVCFTVLLLPILPFILSRKKYRHRILQRFGVGLAGQLASLAGHPTSVPTCWIHALSVGEVTSALPLVRGLREALPELRIVFSATTSSGHQVARHLLTPYTDAIIAGPIDLGPTVRTFIKAIRPDLFILVETDFWPHWLHLLARHQIPLFLVNGRISQKSFTHYRRYAFLFRPMFQTFTLLALQTETDAGKMRSLGIDPDKIVTLGNLKYDTSLTQGSLETEITKKATKEAYGFDSAAPLWICGSTHRGEEQLLFSAFLQLRRTIPDLQLLIAPRNIERADEIVSLGRQCNLDCRTWTGAKHTPGPILILDTIGDLEGCYPMAEVVFIGGSLVPEGGHNPIEPAAAGIPVLFGPHMEDFAEIATKLIDCGGARQVTSTASLSTAVQLLCTDSTLHISMASAAGDCIRANQGVVHRHLESIKALLAPINANR